MDRKFLGSSRGTEWGRGPMTRFICVTGPDGSGKTTLCRELVERWNRRFGDDFAAEVTVWDFLEDLNPFNSKRAVFDYGATLEPIARMKTLMGFYRKSLEIRLRKKHKVLVLNGFWYKYAASELAYG